MSDPKPLLRGVAFGLGFEALFALIIIIIWAVLP